MSNMALFCNRGEIREGKGKWETFFPETLSLLGKDSPFQRSVFTFF